MQDRQGSIVLFHMPQNQGLVKGSYLAARLERQCICKRGQRLGLPALVI